jgi:hypothetical protein
VEEPGDLERSFRPSLERALLHLRRAGPSLADSRIDAVSIARDVLTGLPHALQRQAAPAFDTLMRRALCAGLRPGVSPLRPPTTAEWLERVHLAACAVDPRAIEIAALRLEGCTERDISDRLDLGLRLVRQILGELRLGVFAGSQS